MDESNQIKKREVPTIEELYQEPDLKQRESQLNALLNHPPKNKWIGQHPTAKKEIKDENGFTITVPVEHIPITRIEWLLTWIFKRFRWEILRETLIGNSVVVTVRLWYLNPLYENEVWDFHDGIGAAPLSTKKGAGAIQWDELQTMSVQKASPAAETFARKNAAKKLGKLFGRDLNRNEELNYELMVSRFDNVDLKRKRKEVEEALSKMDESEEKDSLIQELNDLEDNGEATIENFESILTKINKND